MDRLEKNSEFLRNKYQKDKRIKVTDFLIGQNVSVLIPKADRHHSDLKRLQCTIIDKSAGDVPTYKLICAYGIIEKRYTASSLMAYPGTLKIDREKRVSLTEAVRLSNMNIVVFCGCKKACQTQQCKCYNANKNCTSRCHKGKTGKCCNNNQRKQHVLPSVPSFGGKVTIGKRNVEFTNTCALDTWMAIIKCLLTKFPNLQRRLITNLPPNKQAIIPLVKVGKFNEAKYKVINA